MSEKYSRLRLMVWLLSTDSYFMPTKLARILVVEDETLLCDMMRVLLTRWGYEVECANTGTQALENIKNKGCDLALIDLKLPDMSGKDLAPKIKAHHPTIPIIMITAFPPAELPGVDEIISKPLRADTLRQIVQSRIG